jgi:hypothetical protein
MRIWKTKKNKVAPQDTPSTTEYHKKNTLSARQAITVKESNASIAEEAVTKTITKKQVTSYTEANEQMQRNPFQQTEGAIEIREPLTTPKWIQSDTYDIHVRKSSNPSMKGKNATYASVLTQEFSIRKKETKPSNRNDLLQPLHSIHSDHFQRNTTGRVQKSKSDTDRLKELPHSWQQRKIYKKPAAKELPSDRLQAVQNVSVVTKQDNQKRAQNLRIVKETKLWYPVESKTRPETKTFTESENQKDNDNPSARNSAGPEEIPHGSLNHKNKNRSNSSECEELLRDITRNPPKLPTSTGYPLVDARIGSIVSKSINNVFLPTCKVAESSSNRPNILEHKFPAPNKLYNHRLRNLRHVDGKQTKTIPAKTQQSQQTTISQFRKGSEADDSFGSESIGHDFHVKEESYFRFAFVNHNGISLSPVTLADFFQASKELHIDCLGVAESHIDSSKLHVRNKFMEAIHAPTGYNNAHCVFAQSDINYESDRKRGGVLQFAVHNLANRVIDVFSDKYGRFTGQTFIGRNERTVHVITAYRVVEGQAGPSSAYAQQRAMLVTEGRQANPRSIFLKDLSEYIQMTQAKGHAIILGVDANESYTKKGSGIRKLAEQCGLLDVHAAFFPEINWASHRKGRYPIDFLLVSPEVMECVTQAGIVGFDEVFESDHRPLFFDIDANKFFRGVNVDPTYNKSRTFTTKNKKHALCIRQEISTEWERRHLTDRITNLHKISLLAPEAIRRERLESLWEQLDEEIGRVFHQAETVLRIPKNTKRQWSPALAKAGAVKRYWRIRLHRAHDGHFEILSRKARELQIRDDGTDDLPTLQARFDSATKHFASMVHRDVQLREDHINTLQAQLITNSSPEGREELKALKNLQKTEKTQRIFRKIKNTLRPIRSGSLSRVEIPQDMATEMSKLNIPMRPIQQPTSPLSTILQRITRQKRRANEEWVTVIDQATVEQSVLLYCQQHFQQAKQTPFGSGHLSKLLSTSGLTNIGLQILQGEWKGSQGTASLPELQSVISHLAIPEALRNVKDISLEVSTEEYSEAIKKWDERTSTSPSGRHLGFYKVIRALPKIQHDMCRMLNIVVRCGLVPKRWCKAISVMLEKDPGRPSINRLRIIHLFEADYNLFLKIFWARRLVQRGEKYQQFGESQQGSRSGRRANDAVLLKRLTYDLTRQQRSNLGTFDNDAKSCYDRIVNGLAMIAAQRLGMPPSAIATHAGTLHKMQYAIKSAFGVSEGYVQSSPGAFLFGTGQGSGASPAVWLTISTVLLATLSDLVPRGMRYSSPNKKCTVERHSDAFVDDTQNGLTDAHLAKVWSLKTLIVQLKQMAQTWERILHCSGGALELSKCSYYILFWKWERGLPRLTPLAEFPPESTIALTSGESSTETAILQRNFDEPHKTLGVWMTPTGEETAQMDYLRKAANQIAILISSSRLTRGEAFLAYQACWIPAVTYSIGTTTMSKSELRSVQSQALSSFLQKLGVNQHYPRAVVFGPRDMGGLELRDLYVEQGVAQIMLIMEHVYNETETGRLLTISLDTLQMEAGTSGLLLMDTLPSLRYLPNCWIQSLRDFLRSNNLQLHLSAPWNFRLSRKGDAFLMDVFRTSGFFTTIELRHLNAVRIHLKVATVSDISEADGRFIDSKAYNCDVFPHRISLLHWIRQPVITAHQRALWKKALHYTVLRSRSGDLELQQALLALDRPLGPWIHPSPQRWRYYYNMATQSLETPISAVLALAFRSRESTLRQKSAFHKTFQVVAFSLHNRIPADSVERHPNDSFFTAKFDHRTPQHDSPFKKVVPAITCYEYVKQLPPERQRFFAWSQPRGNESDFVINTIRNAIKEKSLLDLAPDGGLMNYRGTFGVVMARGSTDLWEMAGPVDGDPETSNSKRCELAGYAASLELLLMFTSIIQPAPDQKLHTQTWIDSSGAGRHLSNMLLRRKTKRKYPHDPDLLAHVRWLWSQLPNVTHKIRWVKSHQDRDKPFSDLPRNAQLNVIADGLATAFAKKELAQRHNPMENPLPFHACAISLIVNGQRITSYPKEAIRFHINGTRHRQYLQQLRPQWTDQIWNTIDFATIGLAFKSLSVPKRIQTSKLLHGWLPTGHKRHQMDSLALSNCPCCNLEDETQEHIITCRDHRMRAARFKALTTLRSKIVTTKGSSTTWTILHNCLVHWSETKEPPSIDRMVLHIKDPRFVPQIRRAMQEQEQIGWNLVFRGYVSTAWVVAQHQEHPSATIQGLRQQWLKPVIRELWVAVISQWEKRNEILHSLNPTSMLIKESATDAKIRTLYLVKDTFAHSDQVLFNIPLNQRLRLPQRAKKQWIALASRYHPTTTARRKGQQPLITKFFQRPENTASISERVDQDKLQDPPNIGPTRQVALTTPSNRSTHRQLETCT